MKLDLKRLSNPGFSKSYMLGLLIGLQIPYPQIPWFPFAFLAFFLALNLRVKLPSKQLMLILGIAGLGLVSNAVSDRTDIITLVRALTTTLFFVLFLFGNYIEDVDKFLRGYTLVMNVEALRLILTYFTTGTYKLGLLMLLPEHREWGRHYFEGWPNFLAFGLASAFLINALYFRRRGWAGVCLAGALLTSSRTPLIAIALFWLVQCWRSRRVLIASTVLAVAGMVLLSIAAGRLHIDPTLAGRLLASKDRAEIYGAAWSSFEARPLLGSGSVLFGESTNLGSAGADSFHNSYLDLLMRFGIITLGLFLALIYPPKVWAATRFGYAYPALVGFFLLGSLFQNFLKHPHFFMLYSVLVVQYRWFLPEGAAERSPQSSGDRPPVASGTRAAAAATRPYPAQRLAKRATTLPGGR